VKAVAGVAVLRSATRSLNVAVRAQLSTGPVQRVVALCRPAVSSRPAGSVRPTRYRAVADNAWYLVGRV